MTQISSLSQFWSSIYFPPSLASQTDILYSVFTTVYAPHLVMNILVTGDEYPVKIVSIIS